MNSKRRSHERRDRKYGSEWSLILDSRLIIETRAYIKDANSSIKTFWNCSRHRSASKAPDAELVTFASRDLKKADLKFSKSWTQTQASYTKLVFQVLKREVHHARVWRTWDLDLEVNKLAFHQLTRKARWQSMDAWISRKRFHEEIKR